MFHRRQEDRYWQEERTLGLVQESRTEGCSRKLPSFATAYETRASRWSFVCVCVCVCVLFSFLPPLPPPQRVPPSSWSRSHAKKHEWKQQHATLQARASTPAPLPSFPFSGFILKDKQANSHQNTSTTTKKKKKKKKMKNTHYLSLQLPTETGNC